MRFTGMCRYLGGGCEKEDGHGMVIVGGSPRMAKGIQKFNDTVSEQNQSASDETEETTMS